MRPTFIALPFVGRMRTAVLPTTLAALLVAGCATQPRDEEHAPAQHVQALNKVVDRLGTETAQRLETEPYRGLVVVVRRGADGGTQATVAELLRTRLVEKGTPVEVACPARCLEISMIEFAAQTESNGLTPGEVLSVATGSVPGLGLLTRKMNEREKASQHTTALLVTFAAREGNRYLARSHAIAVLSAQKE